MMRPSKVRRISSIRLLNQQLVAPLYSRPDEVVEWMGMVQAQEYRMMRWAVIMRTKRPSMDAFRRAYDSGRIIRTHLFRCTWQLVAAEDLHWMRRLCAEQNRRMINGYLASYGRRITEVQYDRINNLLREVLSDCDSLCKSDLLRRLEEEGVRDDAHTMSIYLRRAEIDGVICSGHLDAENTYALVERRVAQGPDFSREASLEKLARRYFRSHAPATLDDFVWWSGLGVRECRRAVEAISTELEQLDGVAAPLYIHRDSRTRGCRFKTLCLPSYDEYLIGYKSRHYALECEFQSRAYNNFGIFYPVIVSGGKVVGNWHPKKRTSDFFKEEYRENSNGLQLPPTGLFI